MDWTGEFRVEFPFPPESKNSDEFRRAVRGLLDKYDFWLTGEVRVSWVLFLDEERRRCTDRHADCDNYVKTLNDAIKGSAGVLIDDTQILVPQFNEALLGANLLLARIDSEMTLSRNERWQIRKRFCPGVFGYHKSRIIQGGFPIHRMDEWRIEFATDIDNLRNFSTRPGHGLLE